MIRAQVSLSRCPPNSQTQRSQRKSFGPTQERSARSLTNDNSRSADQNLERYAKLPIVTLLRPADLRLPRSSILKREGFA